MGFGIEDQEDFEYICMTFSEIIEYDIKNDTGFSSARSVLDSNQMTLTVKSNGKTLFEYGKKKAADEALIAASEFLNGHSTITQEGRGLYVVREQIKNADYTIYMFGNYYEQHTYSELKTALTFAAIMITFTIFLSILLANRFLTRFVFKRIEEPLDVLSEGVREIKNGNLEYRIPYDRNDEFLPICTDFNEMAVRLKQSVDGLQRQEQSRKELITGISHDLRSPLTSIQAYVEGLLDGVVKTPAAQKKYLETIKRKAEDLAHIISQLFLLSKIGLVEYPEEPIPVSLDKKIIESISPLKDDYAAQGITIHTELEPVQIYADPVNLHRIITNILENSLKYKNKEKGNIWISLKHTADGCRLTVSDDGPGVPDDALSHLFEVFYRSDTARQNPDKGSGLGLAIVASSVQKMGGTINTDRTDYSAKGKHKKYGTSIKYTVADIYISDISCFKTAFANDTFGIGHSEKFTDMSKRIKSILAVNGDSYNNNRHKDSGTIIRNGVIYRSAPTNVETCVLNTDGTMKI